MLIPSLGEDASLPAAVCVTAQLTLTALASWVEMPAGGPALRRPRRYSLRHV